MTRDAWLHVDSVQHGMFRDELAVVVSRTNGTKESFFVPADAVEQTKRLVRVLVRDADNFVWVTLPTSEPNTIPVSKKLIENR
jgi:hypothetical protein